MGKLIFEFKLEKGVTKECEDIVTKLAEYLKVKYDRKCEYVFISKIELEVKKK